VTEVRSEHVKDGVIQTWLDDELPAGLATRVARHLDQCPTCQERGRKLSERTGRISLLLLSLDSEALDIDEVRAWVRPKPEPRASRKRIAADLREAPESPRAPTGEWPIAAPTAARSAARSRRDPAEAYPQLDLLSSLSPSVEAEPIPSEEPPLPPLSPVARASRAPRSFAPFQQALEVDSGSTPMEPVVPSPAAAQVRRLPRGDSRFRREQVVGVGLVFLLGVGLFAWLRSDRGGVDLGTTGDWVAEGGAEGEGGSVLEVELREGRLDVVLRAPHADVGVELQVGVGERVEIIAPLGSRYFPTQGKVEVDLDRAGPGTVYVRIPAIAREVNLIVGLRPVLTWTGGTYRMEEGVPAQTRGESVRIELPELDPLEF